MIRSKQNIVIRSVVKIMSRVQEHDNEMMMKLGKGYQWSAKLTIISLPYLPLERLVLVSNSANNKRSLAMVSRNRRNVKCATCATPSFMELLLAAVCKT